MKKFEGISEEGSVKTESFFSQELDLFFWPLSVLTWTSVSLHWNAFEVVERSNGKDLFLLSTLYKDIRNYWNLLVTDTEFLLEVEPTSLLYCMVFIGSEMLFTLHFTVFWQLVKIGELVFDDLKTFIFEFGTFIRFFFRVLVQVGVTIVLFTKIFADDVDIVFVLPVTICWGECKQAESQLCFKDTGWDILVKNLAIFLPIGCLKLTIDSWIKLLLNLFFTSILHFLFESASVAKLFLFLLLM